MRFRLSGMVAAIILLAAAGLVHAGDLTISKTGEQEVMVIGEKTSYAKKGDTVSEGDEIVIVGKDTVRLESENRIVVMDAHKGSILNYEKTDPDGTIEMGIKKGVVDFEVVPGNKFDVTTPHMVAAVRGTRFTLDVDDFETALMVEKGSVQANDNKGKSMPVGAGQAIRATEQAFTQDTPGTIEEIHIQKKAVQIRKDRIRSADEAKETIDRMNGRDNDRSSDDGDGGGDSGSDNGSGSGGSDNSGGGSDDSGSKGGGSDDGASDGGGGSDDGGSDDGSSDDGGSDGNDGGDDSGGSDDSSSDEGGSNDGGPDDGGGGSDNGGSDNSGGGSDDGGSGSDGSDGSGSGSDDGGSDDGGSDGNGGGSDDGASDGGDGSGDGGSDDGSSDDGGSGGNDGGDDSDGDGGDD